YVEFLGAGETSRYGFSRTRVTEYAGADWERTLVWLKKSKALAVLDRLVARETNDYQFRILWHGVGEPTLDENGLLLTQNGPAMRIQLAPGPALSLYNDLELGTNWKNYPHAEPVVRSLSAIAKTRLEKGVAYLAVSALHASPDGPPSAWRLHLTAQGDGAVLDTETGRLVIGLGTLPFETGEGALDTDAQVVIADAVGLTLLGVSHARLGQKDVLAGRSSIDVPLGGMTARLANIAMRPSESAQSADAGAPNHESAWQLGLETTIDNETAPCDITRLAAARLDGAEKPPLLLASTAQGLLFAINADGTIRWTQDIGAELNDVTGDDLDGDGVDEIVLARQDHHVTVLDATGIERWSRELEHYRRPPYVNLVRTGDITGDGLPEVIAGGENWRFYAFTGTGNELWNYESVHPSRSGAVGDLDGDGKAEVLCGTHYYYMSVLNPDGARRWRHNFGPICYDITTGSFDNNDTRGVVCGGGGGFVHYLAHDGKLRMQYNTGEEVRCVLTQDLDGDARDEILAGSRSHSVYCFDPDGGRRWRTDLGAPITALVSALSEGDAFVLAGTDAGRLVTLEATGALVKSTDLGAEVRDLLVFGEHVVAAASNGKLVAIYAK
ncbi:MAG: PQQ-binding-like beta-propeller repeat protein, partial [Candidatus Hydrogenedentes bacterium]|nr:PQQ-binding-like beta-propeller repeat protein [Candidatus Hydrogenedentota bacterium]